MKKFAAIPLIAALALAGLPAQSQAKDDIKISFATGSDGLSHSIEYVAIDGGFLKKEGLDVDFVELGAGPKQLAAILGGSVQFAALGLNQIIKASEKGGEGVAIAANFNVVDVHLVLSNEAVKRLGITDEQSVDEKVKRIKGITIGVSAPGSGSDTALRTFFKYRGIDPDSVIKTQALQGGPNMLAALEKGVIDGFAWTAPFPQVAEFRGVGKIVIDPFTDDLGEIKNVPYTVQVTSRQVIRDNPEAVRRVIRALDDASKYIQSNPKEAGEIVKKHFPSIDPKVFDVIWDHYRRGIPKRVTVSKEQFDKTQEWINLTADEPVKAEYAKAVDNTFATEISK
jgi:NitT/TauT family transport system substrate-binding protein